MKINILILSLLLLSASAAAQERTKIGLSTALTGPGASWGTDLKNALLFADRHFGGNRYQIIIEDDKCDSRESVTAARKLTDIDRVKAVFTNCSATTLSAAPIFRNAGALVFAPLASSKRVSAVGDYIFRMPPSDAAAAAMLYDYIASRHAFTGVLTETADYATDFFEGFKGSKALRVHNENYLTTDTDFRSVLLKFSHEGIDSLFINSNSEQSFALILRQFRELGLHVPLYGALIPGSAKFLQLTNGMPEGLDFADFPANADSLGEEGKSLFSQFVNEYGPPMSWDISFALTLEAFRAMDAALQSGKDPKAFLHSQKFQGIFGPFFFDQNGDLQGLKPVMRRMEGGKVVTLP